MKKRNVFLSALFTAFFAVLMLGPLMSEAQAASNDLDSYLSTMGDAARDAVGTLKSYAEYDLEKVNTKAGPRVNPNLVKAAKVLKIIGFLEIGSSVVREIKEVVTAYEREGLVAATIEGIGGLLTVGISIYGGILAGIAGAKCAVLPLAAGPMAGFAAFGGCHWVVSKIASILADNGERGLEAILRKLFLH
ncbi:MAG: hypothetical protein JKY92_04365, partial [Magnetovibrio sp.]|nr:hypothetical protein [Magnetovibrio sp.]